MTMPDAVLVLNAGTSSIKLGLSGFVLDSHAFPGTVSREEQDEGHRLTIKDASGRNLREVRQAARDDGGKGLLHDILAWSETYLAGGRLHAVGHRIVHGGPDFAEPVEVTAEIVEALA